MSQRVIEQLNHVKLDHGRVNPDPAWVEINRLHLVQYLRETKAMRRETRADVFRATLSDRITAILGIFLPARLLLFARTGISLVLIGMLAVGGWIASVSASQDSLPGEPLYGVKLAAEKTEIIVATVIGSAENQAATNLKHAAVKVEEIHNAKSSAQAAVSIQSLKEKIESTNKTLAQAESASPGTAVAVAKVVEKKTEEILTALADTKKQKDVSVVENLIEKTSVKAVQVLVDNKTDAGVAPLDVKQTIERKVDRLVLDLARLDTEVGAANTQLAASTTALNAVAVMGPASTTITSTPNVIQPPTQSAVSPDATANVTNQSAPIEPSTTALQKVQVAEKAVQQATKLGETTAAEVKTLIKQDDLKSAIKKVQELGDVKQQTKEAVSQATVAVQGMVRQEAALAAAPTVTVGTSGLASSTAAGASPLASTVSGTTTNAPSAFPSAQSGTMTGEQNKRN